MIFEIIKITKKKLKNRIKKDRNGHVVVLAIRGVLIGFARPRFVQAHHAYDLVALLP